MTIENKIRDEKLQYHINGEAAKISALSSGKIDKHEYLAGEEIIPPDQRKMIEQVKFAYSLLRKAFEKQTKTIEEQRKKQVEALEVLDPEKNQKLKSIERIFPEDMRNNEIKNWENKIKRKNLKYETNIYIYIYMFFNHLKQ